MILFISYIPLKINAYYQNPNYINFILNYDQDIFCDEDGVREFKNNATCPACKLAFNCDNSSSYFFNNHFHTL